MNKCEDDVSKCDCRRPIGGQTICANTRKPSFKLEVIPNARGFAIYSSVCLVAEAERIEKLIAADDPEALIDAEELKVHQDADHYDLYDAVLDNVDGHWEIDPTTATGATRLKTDKDVERAIKREFKPEDKGQFDIYDWVRHYVTMVCSMDENGDECDREYTCDLDLFNGYSKDVINHIFKEHGSLLKTMDEGLEEPEEE